MLVRHLIFAFISLIGVSDACATRKKSPVPESTQEAELTTLRASVPSFVMSGRSGQQELRYVSVPVTNVGSVIARDIVVSVRGSAGLTFPLRGPKKLEPRGRAVYVSTVRVPAGVALHKHAVTSCSTCRR